MRGPSLPHPHLGTSYTRNFATIPHRTREAQIRAASVTCAQIRRAQGRGRAASHRRPRRRQGLRGVSASQALRPDVPGALRARSPGHDQPARDPGAIAAPAPRSMSPAQLGQERGAETPRKLGEFRSLARPKLAPRAGDTSGRLRAPWLLAGGLGQRPPAPPLEPRGRRPAPARPLPAPRWRHPLQPAAPAPACGAGEKTPGGERGARGRSRLLLAGCPSCPGYRVRRRQSDSTVSSAFLPSHAALPTPELQ